MLQKKPYLKKLLWGPPANEDLLDQLWRGYTVDGSTAYVPGDDYGDAEQEEEEEEEATPVSANTKWNKRNKKNKISSSATTSTCTSPLKKSKSPMVKIVKDIATTYKASVEINTKHMESRAKEKESRAQEKAAISVKRCQELAFECGVEKTIDSIYAMSKMFETSYQREFFYGLEDPELRLGYFKRWCRDHNMEC
jgi:hypothetical protein